MAAKAWHPAPGQSRLRRTNVLCILRRVAAGFDHLLCRGLAMRGHFTLEYWRDGKFYVGRLLEVPGVFSQGKTLEELRENIQDAYDVMVTQERTPAPAPAQQQPVELDV